MKKISFLIIVAVFVFASTCHGMDKKFDVLFSKLKKTSEELNKSVDSYKKKLEKVTGDYKKLKQELLEIKRTVCESFKASDIEVENEKFKDDKFEEITIEELKKMLGFDGDLGSVLKERGDLLESVRKRLEEYIDSFKEGILAFGEVPEK